MSYSDVQKYTCNKNGVISFKFLCTESHKKLWRSHKNGEKFFKSILTNCTKHDEINICHSDIQKHVFDEKMV